MAVEERTRIVLRPVAVDDSGFTVTANKDGSFNISGPKIMRWVRQTNFKNAEAIGYLADRMAQLGVEKELFKQGAVAGNEVRVGVGDDAVIFDWEPTIESGAELLGARGEDVRFDSIWRGPEKARDQLSTEELARQWEFTVIDPRTPALVEELKMDAEDVAEDAVYSEDSQ
jgi:GTP-binding protein